MDVQTRIKTLEKEVELIKNRNKLVESNKAWETSLTRRVSIVVFTYLTICLFFIIIKTPSPFINALVPSLGFILSTLSLGAVRKYWQRHWHK